VWIDLQQLIQRAAAELAQANGEVLRLREANERLEQRIKALEAHQG
jgi:phage shock protein A